MNKLQYTEPLEPYTRQVIENKLSILGYNMDESNQDACNVYRERAKYIYQNDLFEGKRPDFLIYESGKSRILAVIEAKRPSTTLDKAISQALDYARLLDIPAVFVYNSSSFYACTQDGSPIKIDDTEINDFVNEKTLIKLIDSNFKLETVPEGFTLSRADLLGKFKKCNNILRKAGLRDGYERFSVFADLMFLKLKNDFSDIGESEDKLDEMCNWDILMGKTPARLGNKYNRETSEVGTYLNDTIRPRLKKHYGDVFETSLNIEDEGVLCELLEEIDGIDFKNVDSDVKGDAFEFFLRKVTNGNKDLGEYYTPRHIVKMMVKLINPVYGETIYDPCSGTGGFLLECFKHLRENTDIRINPSDSELVIEEKKIKKTFIKEKSIFGREITSTARIAKMNMILFGDGHTNIKQMDCLSKKVTEQFKIAISNIPYSQKVDHGALYEFSSNKGDSIFMQHIWSAIEKGGRMAVVVPDTFLYHKDVKAIREKIIKESSKLVVISLPRGVFNPYTPTKTSILYACKRKNGEKGFGRAFFFILRNDGFELGARRRPLPGRSDCSKFFMYYNDDEDLRMEDEPISVNVPYTAIADNNFSLFPFNYMEHRPIDPYATHPLSEFIKERESHFKLSTFKNKDEECVILAVTKYGIYKADTYTANDLSNLSQKYKRVFPGDFTYNPHRINVGSIGIVPNIHKNMYVSNIYPVFYLTDKSLPPYYLLKQLKTEEYKEIINDYCIGGARADLKIGLLEKIRIALPSDNERDDFEDKSQKLERAFNNYLKIMNEIMNF